LKLLQADSDVVLRRPIDTTRVIGKVVDPAANLSNSLLVRRPASRGSCPPAHSTPLFSFSYAKPVRM